MNECKYCNSPINGDIPEDHKFLIDEDIDRENKKSISNGVFSVEYKETEYFSMWADVYGNELCVCLNEEELDKENLRDVVCENIYKINIKYCPMCGRKLG